MRSSKPASPRVNQQPLIPWGKLLGLELGFQAFHPAVGLTRPVFEPMVP